ncbi:MAG: hypothetical protein HQL73_10830 [Magnetococcales bacterium]|nr:hypothetical protein [Magnetococcales bacterium]
MANPRHKKPSKGQSGGSIKAASTKPVFVKEGDEEWDPEQIRARKKKKPSSIPLWINVIAYSVFFWGLRMVGKALPEESTFFTRMFELEISHPNWDIARVKQAWTWMTVLSGFSLLHLGVGIIRSKGRFQANEVAALILPLRQVPGEEDAATSVPEKFPWVCQILVVNS